jgi:hypothetical protein
MDRRYIRLGRTLRKSTGAECQAGGFSSQPE